MAWEGERGGFFFALPLAAFEVEFVLIDSQKKMTQKKIVTHQKWCEVR